MDYTDTVKALEKAEDSLENARYNLDGRFYETVANRAYYSRFYSLCALLYTKGVYAKTPQGTHSKFSELFIKTNLFPTKISESISILFNSRQKADYDIETDLTREDAEILIDKADQIYHYCQTYFQKLQK